ncbi:MAG: UDP-glucose 4-epimerase GalE [Alphaproteobacteria bacterium]|nr:UDP-glucose 4-epimerase GalE [Alphaproteobacteria bacterium]
MAKVLVVGGAGYIGSHVVLELLDKGHEVVVFDNLSTGQKVNLFDKAEFVQGDILDVRALENVMSRNFDVVIHMAALKAVGESMAKPEIYATGNITGGVNILNAMVKFNVKNIVFSSSAAVYGMPKYLPVDEKHEKEPINFYGYTKSFFEDLMDWYHNLKAINFISLRYFNAVGYDALGRVKGKEKNPQNLLPIIIEAATGKRNGFEIYGNDYDTEDGTCERDYIHVSDLASAHEKAVCYLMTEKKSHVLNLGTGQAVSVRQMVEATEKVIGRPLKYAYAPRRPGDPAKLVATSSLARQVLGWTPKYTNIKDIIQTTWNMEK